MLTSEQKAELERRGWEIEAEVPGEFQEWVKDPNGYAGVVRFYDDGHPYLAGPSPLVIEAAAILGIAPPGYRLVPEDTIEAAVRSLLDAADAMQERGR